MVMNISINGVRQVNHFVLALPKNLDKDIMNSSEEFARAVQKSAKLRAPRNTGALAKSITVKRGNNKIEITVDSPYGIFQEQGFTPHWVHTGMPNRSGGTIGSALKMRRRGFVFVRGFKPFIVPALEQGLNMLPILLNRAVEKSIAKSRR